MYPILKRSLDVVVSFVLLLFLFPFFAIVTVLIKLDSEGGIFYRGMRIGKYGNPFWMFKFRTMVADAEKTGGSSTPEDDPRVVRVGQVLRRYKLDELPQLINVFLGDMSLVGPRPQVPWAVELYTEEEKALLSVRPGMTDYASILFRNEADILRGSSDPDKDYLEKIAPKKIRLGLEYVRTASLWVDMKILLATVWGVLGGRPERWLGLSEERPASASSVAAGRGSR